MKKDKSIKSFFCGFFSKLSKKDHCNDDPTEDHVPIGNKTLVTKCSQMTFDSGLGDREDIRESEDKRNKGFFSFLRELCSKRSKKANSKNAEDQACIDSETEPLEDQEASTSTTSMLTEMASSQQQEATTSNTSMPVEIESCQHPEASSNTNMLMGKKCSRFAQVVYFFSKPFKTAKTFPQGC